MELNDKVLVITGASSGIGRALAIESMRRGACVALADVNLEAAWESKGLAEDVAASGSRCTVHELDVSSLEAWRSFKEDVIREHGVVDGVINNAGISFNGSIEDMSYHHLEQVMSINFMGMVYGTKEFLPLLKARPQAAIANVSSVFGLFPRKDQAAYCASKYAIRGFTEVLDQELKDSSVSVATVYPGHISTNIVRNARDQGNVVMADKSEEDIEGFLTAFETYGMPPENAAAIILDGIQNRQRRILVGDDAVQGDRLSRQDPEGFADSTNAEAG